ncbi:hypothetical protein HF086_011573 [Spodoptera exigua]|uniref:Ig-like domain-containing protein n=1 Tax=Spodoptera exigua TaxID=7107 RepID=A0A922MCY3_SPOEX|nr:hypothetical protein HF086_011573 [Spodoptera exigua]
MPQIHWMKRDVTQVFILTKKLFLEPVHFESVGANLTTKMGLPVTLTCRPLGDNPIRVKWSLDGKPIDFTSSR